jgi:hypothetical protein
MPQSIYEYERLPDLTKYLRLITLLPGEGDEQIKLRITPVTLAALGRSASPYGNDQHLKYA